MNHNEPPSDRSFRTAADIDSWYYSTVRGLAKVLSAVAQRHGHDSLDDDMADYAATILTRMEIARARCYEVVLQSVPQSPAIGIAELSRASDPQYLTDMVFHSRALPGGKA